MANKQRPHTAPAGVGWQQWHSAAQPQMDLWISESRREIVIVDGDGERRINAADDTAFALELHDIERYYGAAPLAGGRDSAALLAREQTLVLRRRGLRGAVAALRDRVWSGRGAAPDRGRNGRRRRRIREIISDPGTVAVWAISFALCSPILGAVLEGLQADRAAEVEWADWASRKGSERLRAALHDAEFPRELFSAEVAAAVVPPVEGTSRCPVGASVRGPLPKDGRERELTDSIRHAVTLAAATFPAAAKVDVGELSACWLPAQQVSARCLPVTLAHGRFVASGCYVLDRP